MTHPELVAELRRIAGERGVVSDPDALMTYNADGCVMDTHSPDVVVLPTTTEQVVAIVKLAAREKIPVIARGAGTGLSGGATPMRGVVIIVTSRMEKILEVDTRNNRCRVQPGVINFELTAFLKTRGYQFAADPFVAESVHDWREYREQQRRTALPQVRRDRLSRPRRADGAGRWDSFSGRARASPEQPGYDLTGITVGAEGTTCVITECWLKILPLPEGNPGGHGHFQ